MLKKSDVEKIFNKNGQKNCQFLLGAQNSWQFPDLNYPEFAFIGASNVGKSSLINGLTSQKIAITSNMPGRTRQLNFFMLANRLIIVDMPGYGFARAKEEDILSWKKTSFEYFENRKNLKRVFLLIDAVKGLKNNDLEMIDVFISLNISFQIILTKSDKIKYEELKKVKQNIEGELKLWPLALDEILICSAKNKNGLDDIKNSIILAL